MPDFRFRTGQTRQNDRRRLLADPARESRLHVFEGLPYGIGIAERRQDPPRCAQALDVLSLGGESDLVKQPQDRLDFLDALPGFMDRFLAVFTKQTFRSATELLPCDPLQLAPDRLA